MLSPGRILELGAEPADDSAAFFFGPLVVKGNEFFQDFFVGEVGWPAIGLSDGGVEVVVDLAEDGDKALLVDLLFFPVEWFAGAEFFQHVVHAGHRELGVLRLLALAMGVELFAEFADAGFLGFGGIGEGKCFEAAGFVVTRAIFECAAA